MSASQRHRKGELRDGSRIEDGQREKCRHDSTRRDGLLDDHCLNCGAEGYWHCGQRRDRRHPSGKLLFVLFVDDADDEEEVEPRGKA